MQLIRKILVLDDHRLFLEGLKHLLNDLDGDFELELVSDVPTAIENIDQGKRYALLIVDLSMPGMDGFSFLQSMLERNKAIPVLVISSTQSIADVKRALSLGALGFVRKTADSSEMLLAVKQVLLGNIYLPDDVWHSINEYPTSLKETHHDNNNPSDIAIGKRQLEVLRLVIDGLSNKNIAAVLNIQEPTVKYHVGNLFKHFVVASRTQLIKKTRDMCDLEKTN